MKGFVFHGPGRSAWEDVPDPGIKDPTDAVVRVDAVTICGTDLHILKGDVPEVRPGTVLGHEAVGEIVETGGDVRTVRPGDRVLVSCITACGRCRFCKEAAYGQCQGGGGWILGHLIDGTQAEYVRVPHADLSVHPLPGALESHDAVLFADIFPTAYEVGVTNGNVRPGDTVAVVGVGPIGLAAVLTARLYTPARIIAVDLARRHDRLPHRPRLRTLAGPRPTRRVRGRPHRRGAQQRLERTAARPGPRRVRPGHRTTAARAGPQRAVGGRPTRDVGLRRRGRHQRPRDHGGGLGGWVSGVGWGAGFWLRGFDGGAGVGRAGSVSGVGSRPRGSRVPPGRTGPMSHAGAWSRGACAGLGRMEARLVGVDVGSVSQGRFAWAALDAPGLSLAGQGADPETAVQAVIAGLASGGRAALVLEAPMSVPVPAADRADGWELLGRARTGEGNRPWSAGAGAGVLATGVAQAAWMAARLADLLPGTTVTTRPDRWATPHGPRLLLAEALVSGAGKPVPTASGPHAADAEAAARALAERLPELPFVSEVGTPAERLPGVTFSSDVRTPPDPPFSSDVPTPAERPPELPLASDVRCAPHRPLNLLAACALWAGLDVAPDELRSDVLVLRARPPRPHVGRGDEGASGNQGGQA